MKAMVLAAGEGKRLQPLTYSFPKPLVPVVNRPVMEHIFFWLSKHGIREVVVNTHYRADQIESYFGDGSRFGIRIHYSREEKLWGTAGGVSRVKDHFHETFLVIGGDDLSDVELSDLLEHHRRQKAIATIGLKEVERTDQYGVVVTGEAGRIRRFQEKPDPSEALSRLANTGIYVFEPEIFRYIPEGEVFDFGKQLFPILLEKNERFYGFEVKGYWCDVGGLGEYKESHWAILEGSCKAKIPGEELAPGIRAEGKVDIHPKAVVRPPCLFGEGTVVEEGAVIGGYVVAGKNVRLGRGATAERTIVWEGTRVEPGAVLRDCVVTRETAAIS